MEINIEELTELASDIQKQVRKFVDSYVMEDGRKLYLLGEGRLINLAAAEGHPASVMDMSFATQALATEWVVTTDEELEPKVHIPPESIEEWIAETKLRTMDMYIDELTPEQVDYLSRWDMGT